MIACGFQAEQEGFSILEPKVTPAPAPSGGALVEQASRRIKFQIGALFGACPLFERNIWPSGARSES